MRRGGPSRRCWRNSGPGAARTASSSPGALTTSAFSRRIMRPFTALRRRLGGPLVQRPAHLQRPDRRRHSGQKALKTAPWPSSASQPSRPAHDALGDAYHTACHLHAAGPAAGAWPSTAPLPQSAARMGTAVHRSPAASAARSTTASPASRTHLPIWPVLKTAAPPAARRSRSQNGTPQQGKRYLTMTTCPEHGPYLAAGPGWSQRRAGCACRPTGCSMRPIRRRHNPMNGCSKSPAVPAAAEEARQPARRRPRHNS